MGGCGETDAIESIGTVEAALRRRDIRGPDIRRFPVGSGSADAIRSESAIEVCAGSSPPANGYPAIPAEIDSDRSDRRRVVAMWVYVCEGCSVVTIILFNKIRFKLWGEEGGRGRKQWRSNEPERLAHRYNISDIVVIKPGVVGGRGLSRWLAARLKRQKTTTAFLWDKRRPILPLSPCSSQIQSLGGEPAAQNP